MFVGESRHHYVRIRTEGVREERRAHCKAGEFKESGRLITEREWIRECDTCSSPMRARSQMFSRRSTEQLAKIVSLKGDHCTWKTSSVCCSKEWSFLLNLRRSHRPTVYIYLLLYEYRSTYKTESYLIELRDGRRQVKRTLSDEPVARIHSLKGLKAIEFTSALWATT